MSNFKPVRTKAELDTLDQAEMVEGYMSAERGDPEPGPNRGKSFWHGWRNRMIDMHELPMDEAAMQLVREIVRTNGGTADVGHSSSGEGDPSVTEASGGPTTAHSVSPRHETEGGK